MKSSGRVLRGIAAFFTIMGLGTAPAWAGGIAVYEMGTPDVGLATAGWVGRA